MSRNLFRFLVFVLALCGVTATASAAPGDTLTGSVQRGINFLTPDVVAWDRANNCAGCHRQGAALFGLSVSQKAGYDVDLSSTDGIGYIATRVANDQHTDGGWFHADGFELRNSKTSYAFFGLAGYDKHVSTQFSQTLVRAADWALSKQEADGRWHEDHGVFPTTYGETPVTARMIVGLAQAMQRVDTNKAATYRAAMDRAMGWIRTNKSGGEFVEEFQIAWGLIGLKAGGATDADADVVWFRNKLLTTRTGAAWGNRPGQSPDGFNTGVALYALCQAGVEGTDASVRGALDWLVQNQHPDGYWFAGSTHHDIPTTFAVLGGGCYGNYSVKVTNTGATSQVVDFGVSNPQTVSYTFTVENRGFQADTYKLSVAGGMPGWSGVASPAQLSLASGDSATITLTVTAPANLPQALRVDMTLVATSQSNNVISDSARVTTYSNPPPPTSGNPTRVDITSGANATVQLGLSTQTLAARVTDTSTNEIVKGPSSGVVTFFVAGVALGTDTDADGDGKFELDWRAPYDFAAVGVSDYRVIYSGIDRASGTDLLSSLTATTIDLVRPADIFAPTITLGALPNFTNALVTTISGNAHDAETTVTKIVIFVDGLQIAEVTPDASGNFSLTRVLDEGAREITAQAFDVANNSAATSVSTVVDRTAPTLTIVSPALGQIVGSTTLVVTASAQDATPTSITIGGTTGSAAQGLVTGTILVTDTDDGEAFDYVISARDAAGNTTTASGRVTLDLDVPIVDIVDYADGQIIGPDIAQAGQLPVTAHCFDTSETSMTLDGEAFAGKLAQKLVQLTRGLNTITAECTDPFGRTGTARLTVIYDDTAPVASFLAKPESLRGQVEIALDIHDDYSGVAWVLINNTDAEQDPVSGAWTATIDTSLIGDGPVDVTATFADGAGNAGATTFASYVDNTAPTLVRLALVEAPHDNFVSGTVQVEATFADAGIGIGNVTVSLAGTALGVCATATCLVNVNTIALGLPDGPFVLVASATDKAHNASVPAQLSLIADNNAPAKFLTSPSNGSIIGPELVIKVDVEDPYFSSVECSFNGASVGTSNNAHWSTTLSTLALLDGAYTVTCTATDSAGNRGTESATVNVRNWTINLITTELNLKAKYGNSPAQLFVEGANVSVLMPLASKALTLRVPGGSPVAWMPSNSDAVKDRNNNGVPDLEIRFERAALLSAIKAGIDAGAIDASKPITVTVYSNDRAIGSALVEVK